MVIEHNIVEELRTVKDRVKYLLEKYPNTRNNDFYLQLLYLKYFEGVPLPYIDYSVVRRISGKLGTISRVRRKIQHEEGLFPPTSLDVAINRETRSEIIRENIHKI